MELIVLVRSNPIFSDPRVQKEVNSLTRNGLSVVILAWDRECIFKSYESSVQRTLFRLRLRAPYGKPLVVVYYPFFWLWVLSKLIRISPGIIHACDVDTFVPALIYRLISRKTKIILDMFDNYGLLIESRNNTLGRLVTTLERYAASKSDAFLTVSEERLALFGGTRLKLAEIVMNCPSGPESTLPKASKITSSAFRLVYAGIISSDRGLLQIAEATKDQDFVELLIAGRVNDIDVLNHLISFPKVKYLGQLNFEDSLRLESSADAIPVLYDPKFPINRVASPSKLFEAMMLGVPIITNLHGILREVHCGIDVRYNDKTEIRDAILQLKASPELKRELGNAGRLAFEQRYNWPSMEERLLRVYRQLLGAME